MAGTGAQILPWCAAPRLITGAGGRGNTKIRTQRRERPV